MTATYVNAGTDPVVQPAPGDTVQMLKFAPNPQMNFVAACGWDGKTSVWEFAPTLQSQLKAQVSQDPPVLSVAWRRDCAGIFTGGCDNLVKYWDLATNQVSTIGTHRAPVREVVWCDGLQHVISGSWDQTLAFWDCRQQNPTATLQLTGRVFGMALEGPLLACILSDKKVATWNVTMIQQGRSTPEIITENLKYQIRSLAVSSDAKTVALGLIEGRVMIKKVTPDNARLDPDFAFKCHRDSQIHSVNSMAFSPVYHTLVTGGSDGVICIWDKQARQKQKGYNGIGAPVTAVDVKCDSTLMVYAAGYDWHKGIEFAGSSPNKIAIRDVRTDSKSKNSY